MGQRLDRDEYVRRPQRGRRVRRAVRLILGGRAKGEDYGAFVRDLPANVRAVYLSARRRTSSPRSSRPQVARTSTGTIRGAVEAAARDAEPGDVVLLSPACASYDQYRDFEERGDDFRRLVLALD